MARESVKIVDKSLRLAYKRMRAELSGKRRNPVVSKFKARKAKLLDDPWLFGGIDEKGRTGVWPSNARNTVWRKMRDHFGTFGVVEKHSKAITEGDRRKWLMVEPGTLRQNVRVGHSPKKSQFFISAPGTGKYAYMHLFGKAGAFPARPWGVWTIKDVQYLVHLLEKWGAQFGDALKRAA
jgi:hypothetical protein